MADLAPQTLLLERGEGRLEYEVAGDGPLVVCLPGMGELRSSYRFTTPVLVEAGFRVAAMDLRGHGGSDATFSRYDDVAAGQDALALVEQLGGGPVVIVGNSMGAGAAVWAAAEQPGAVAGVVLIGPFVRNTPINPLLSLSFKVLMSGPWAPRMWAWYLPRLYPGRRPDDFAEHTGAIRQSMRQPGHAAAFTATTRTSHAPAEERLPAVKAAALVVMGSADPDFPDPAAEGRWVAERLGGRLSMVERAGHYPQVEYPDVVTPELVAFCTEAHHHP